MADFFQPDKYTLRFRNGTPAEQGSMVVFTPYSHDERFGGTPYLIAVRSGTNNDAAASLVEISLDADGSDERRDWIVLRASTVDIYDQITLTCAATFLNSGERAPNTFADSVFEFHPYGVAAGQYVRFDCEKPYGLPGSNELVMFLHGKQLLDTNAYANREIFDAHPNYYLPEIIFSNAPGGRGVQPLSGEVLNSPNYVLEASPEKPDDWPYQSRDGAVYSRTDEDYIEFDVLGNISAGATIKVNAPNGGQFILVRNANNPGTNIKKASFYLNGDERNIDSSFEQNNACWINEGTSLGMFENGESIPVSGTWLVEFYGTQSHGQNPGSPEFTFSIAGKRFSAVKRSGGEESPFGIYDSFLTYDWRTNEGEVSTTPLLLSEKYRGGQFAPTFFTTNTDSSRRGSIGFSTGIINSILHAYRVGVDAVDIMTVTQHQALTLVEDDFTVEVLYSEGVGLAPNTVVKTVPGSHFLASVNRIDNVPYNPATGGTYSLRTRFNTQDPGGQSLNSTSSMLYIVPPMTLHEDQLGRSKVEFPGASTPDPEGGLRYHGYEDLRTRHGNLEQFKSVTFVVSDFNHATDLRQVTTPGRKFTLPVIRDAGGQFFHLLVREGPAFTRKTGDGGVQFIELPEDIVHYAQVVGERYDGTFALSAIQEVDYSRANDPFADGPPVVGIDYFAPYITGSTRPNYAVRGDVYVVAGDIDPCTQFEALFLHADDGLPLDGAELDANPNAIREVANAGTPIGPATVVQAVFESLEPGLYTTCMRGEAPDGRVLYSPLIQVFVIGVPELSVVPVAGIATDVDSDSAQLNGTLLNLGNEVANVTYRFKQGTSVNPTTGQLIVEHVYPDQTAEVSPGFPVDVSQLTGDTLDNLSTYFFVIEVD